MSRHRNVINTKRSGHCAFHDGPQDVNFVEIAQPWVRMKPVPNGWTDDTMPEKMADPGRPVISISIRQHHFDGLICDTGSSVYIIPKVIYSSVLDFGLLLPSNIRLRFTNQTIRQVEGIVGLRMSRQFIRPDRFCGIGYRIRHELLSSWDTLFCTPPMPPSMQRQPKSILTWTLLNTSTFSLIVFCERKQDALFLRSRSLFLFIYSL
jgi:hypothetical protein